MSGKAKSAGRVAVGAVEVLAPLGAIGWGAGSLWGPGAAAILVGGLLWARYMADVLRGR